MWGLLVVAVLRTTGVYEEKGPPEQPWRTGAADVAGSERWLARPLDTKRAGGRSVVEVRAGVRRFTAEVDAFAVVRMAPGVHPRSLALHDVLTVRPLMKAAGLWQVRSARAEEDGLALAQRLTRHVGRDGLRGVSADFWLPVQRASFDSPPNDPRYGGQWYFSRLDMEAAWRLTTGSAEIEVAVIDDGCDLAHPDLAGKLLPGRDVLSQDDDPSYVPNSTSNEHGTACAGLVGAATNNQRDIAGACPECKLRCVRLIPGDGETVALSSHIDAFDFVLTSGSDIASNSWGFSPGVPAPPALVQAIETVMQQGRGGLGAVVVFAAGNASSTIQPDELAAIPGVITVGAINNFDEATAFSNNGESVALTATAGTLTLDISGADGANATDVTSSFGGTSSACPVVAGIAGLVLAARPSLTGADVRAALIASARPAPFAQPDSDGHDLVYGYGIVDPAAALVRVRPEWATSPDAGADAGETDSPSDEGGDGCGCASGSSAGLVGGVGLALVTLLRRARGRGPNRES